MFKFFIIALFPFVLLADILDYYSMAILPSIIVNQQYGKAGSHDTAFETIGDTTVYYPVDRSVDTPTPVVFFTPGWKSTDHNTYKSLLEFIASHGYHVIYVIDEGFSWENMIPNLIGTAENANVAPFIDTSKIGVIGYSMGGGHVFNVLATFSNDKGWGENGRFILAIEPYFTFEMNQSDMRTLPSNTNVVIQQYGIGGNNDVSSTDARIPLSQYYLLDSIADNKKDYQIFEDADHHYPTGSRPYSEMQGLLKPLDALMEYTFKSPNNNLAQRVALEVGNDDPYSNGEGIQVVKAKSEYNYRCDSYVTNDNDIEHCDINGYPAASIFDYIATNNTVEKPEYNASVLDAEFNTTITRFTDRINQNDTPTQNANGDRYSRGNAQPYPKTQAWNSDMSMIRLHYRLYNAKPFEELAITSGTNVLGELYDINGAMSEMKWSSVDPNVFYGVWSSQFWKGTINRENNNISYDLVHDFSVENDGNYEKFTLGKYEGNVDFNDKYVVFAARKSGSDHLTAIVYDMQLDQIKVTKDLTEALWPDEGQVFDWISVSPLGNHILMSTDDSIEQYDMNLNLVRTLANSGGHGDLGVDQYGAEVYVQFEYYTAEYGDNSGIWIYRLSDGYRIRLLPDKYNGGHISCRNYNRKGWCYASTNSEGHREVFAIKLDYTGPDNHIVNRFAQTHTSGHNSQGNVSPDGRKMLFYSDWGDDTLHWADRDTYHVELLQN